MTVQGRGSGLAGHGLSKSFGTNLVLDDVDLEVCPGEVVALMGANGAGKSTLVKILSGVYRPDRGTLSLDGRPLSLSGPAAARAAGIVSGHQQVAQSGVETLSVAENLALDAICGGGMTLFASPRRIRARAAAVAAQSGLAVDLDASYGSLSLAERQLVVIARALALRSRLLILDEPTASLSAAECARLFALIDRLRADGTGILLISHKLADLQRVADRAIVLRQGRVAGCFAAPIDLAGATACMLGRRLDTRRRSSRPSREAGTGAPLLRLHALRLRTGSPPIDLDLQAGEVTVLTGGLGSGKTSLLEILFGVRPPADGRITLDGAAWHPRGPAAAIAGGAFLAAEDRWRSSLLPQTAQGGGIAGNIALPHLAAFARWRVFTGRGRELAVAREAIRRLGIVCRDADDPLEHLSGGNQQKVVLARWLARPSRLLMLDEPFQGVDLGARHDLVASLAAVPSGSAVLIATSDMEEALEAADRILVMRDRAVVADERPPASPQEQAGLVARLAALESLAEGAGREVLA